MKYLICIVFSIGIQIAVFAQDKGALSVKDSTATNEIYLAALQPSKAAFYSAILPGLGQAYNKKYWKIPLVYGSFAATTYYFIYNNDKYQEYRSIFKEKKIDENSHPEYSLEVLQRAQKYHKKNRDLSMLVTLGVYVLQIVEASVDAHLQYHNTDNTLSIAPILFRDPINGKTVLSAGLTYNF
ncbi:MAG TPA: hypothetical protein ENK75_02355 [Saprospiraceae bacterium]|nr:hypothetical protein [Saprospiraceae bacterium]